MTFDIIIQPGVYRYTFDLSPVPADTSDVWVIDKATSMRSKSTVSVNGSIITLTPLDRSSSSTDTINILLRNNSSAIKDWTYRLLDFNVNYIVQ